MQWVTAIVPYTLLFDNNLAINSTATSENTIEFNKTSLNRSYYVRLLIEWRRERIESLIHYFIEMYMSWWQ